MPTSNFLCFEPELHNGKLKKTDVYTDLGLVKQLEMEQPPGDTSI